MGLEFGGSNNWFKLVLLQIKLHKAVINKKNPKFVNRKSIFHQDNAKICFFNRDFFYIIKH